MVVIEDIEIYLDLSAVETTNLTGSGLRENWQKQKARLSDLRCYFLHLSLKKRPRRWCRLKEKSWKDIGQAR